MKRWCVRVVIPHLMGSSTREVTVLAATRRAAKAAGLQNVKGWDANLFAALEGIPRVTARPL